MLYSTSILMWKKVMHTTRLYLLAKALWAKFLKNCLGFSWKLEFRNSSFLWAETKIFLYNYAQSEIVMVPGGFPESTLEID